VSNGYRVIWDSIGRLKLSDTHSRTVESSNNRIALYEAWNKPEKANEWRAKRPQTEVVEE